ncbi:putative short-chain dehydrogenase [Bimuria novae-zelandiae CBS 107.79]|uniref:Putative short-chain dehydrogenase n=1 Tax=Bimuria novae-zelandiae CBS 107.79 TaxID=1447943 RepID=A0A6A5VL68_9PLEO|nr:putative short-chain dehydrogenase [Bimuria novae-zelandiae CBS 107.79]
MPQTRDDSNASPVEPRKIYDLAGLTSIVTGSSRGIGAGIAFELARRGANVVVNYTSSASQSLAESVISTIEKCGSGARAVAIQANIVTTEGQNKIVQAALDLSKEGKINIIVHNAGNADDCYLPDVTEDFYEMQTDLNVKAPTFLTQKVIPHMPRGGRIILVSSASARMGVAQQTVYAATKASNESFSRVWATELGQSKGITVNCVNPGPVATDGYFNSTQEFLDDLKPLIDSTPAAARVGEVRDIAPIVGFLASEESRWVTGSTISACGGLIFF